MAEIVAVTVSKGVTVSVGKFESVRIDAQCEVRGEEGEDSDSLFEIGFETIDEQVNSQIEELQGIVTPESVFHHEDEKKTKKTSSRKRG